MSEELVLGTRFLELLNINYISSVEYIALGVSSVEVSYYLFRNVEHAVLISSYLLNEAIAIKVIVNSRSSIDKVYKRKASIIRLTYSIVLALEFSLFSLYLEF